MEAFAEDWNESQFWVRNGLFLITRLHTDGNAQYSDETATVLAEELLRGADAENSIAVVSAPSVFVQLKNLLVRETGICARNFC
jgi:hypothetical protein